MNLVVHVAVLTLLAVVLFAVWMYRKWLDDHEDHNIHLRNTASDTNTIVVQENINKRLEMLEKTIRYLTIIVIVYAVVVAGVAIYNGWNSSGS